MEMNISSLRMDLPYPRNSLNLTDVKIQYENRALSDLFFRIPIGLILISEDQKVLYYNPLAEYFHDQCIGLTTGNRLEQSGDFLYSKFVKNSRVQWKFHSGRQIFFVNLQSFPLKSEKKGISTVFLLSIQSSAGLINSKIKPVNEYGLSSRQIQIVGMIWNGYTNKEIANELFLSVHTVNKHVENLLEKTGAKNRISVAQKVFG